jgi:hypothetical protein
MSTVYHVTEKGLIELGSRRPSLPAEIREILKLVDGRRSSSELIAVLGRSATVAGGLRWLAQAGFVKAKGGTSGSAPREAAAGVLDVTADPMGEFLPTLAELHDPAEAPAAQAPAPAAQAAPVVAAEAIPVAERYRLLSSFLTESVKEHLGLRGFAHQIKIERASTIEDLAERIEPIADAIARAVDRKAANAFVKTAEDLFTATGS